MHAKKLEDLSSSTPNRASRMKLTKPVRSTIITDRRLASGERRFRELKPIMTRFNDDLSPEYDDQGQLELKEGQEDSHGGVTEGILAAQSSPGMASIHD